MGIPTCDGEFGALPPGVHRATLPEVRRAFVDEAPDDQKAQRLRVFRALELHIEQVSGLLPGATIWLDGGFITHKSWAAPEDADVLYIAEVEQVAALTDDVRMHMLTTSGVAGALGGSPDGPRMGVPRLQPMGGLIDAFVAARLPAQIEFWRMIWSAVKGPNGLIVQGASKGFVEVVS